jgi:hypothetical protein
VFDRRKLSQVLVAAWPVDTGSCRGLIESTVGGAHQIYPSIVQKMPWKPIQFDRNMGTTIQIGMHDPFRTNCERRLLGSEIKANSETLVDQIGGCANSEPGRLPRRVSARFVSEISVGRN